MTPDAITRAVANAVRDTVASPTVPADPGAIMPITEAVAPIIVHATNNEPWYLSRVTWGALLSAVGATSALVGYPIAEEMQSRILEVIALWTTFGGLIAGPALTLYGRWKAKKPIGA